MPLSPDNPKDSAQPAEVEQLLQKRVLALEAEIAALKREIVKFKQSDTERKRIEAALQQSELNLAAELDAAQRLQQVSMQLIQADKINELHDQILDTAMAIMHSDFASIQMFHPERGTAGELRLIGSRGFSREAATFWEWVRPDSESTCGRALKTMQRVIISDVLQAESMAGSADLETYLQTGIRAVQTTPLISRSGTLLGMLSTHWRKPYEPTESELRSLDVLARQAADLIDRKRAEEALKEYTKRLERSNEDLKRFAYISSHDLQEPLRTMVAFSQLLERKYKGQIDPDADEYIRYIVTAGKRMQSLINDLLDYSRVTTKGAEFCSTDVTTILKGALIFLHPKVQENDATITYDSLPKVMADALQLQLVFQNLIGNAIKFRKPDTPPEIHISGKMQDDMIQFSVADNGIGIEPQYFNRIFIIFQKLHGMDTFEGTGIGLSICKRIIDLHEGRIWVESEPGKGSTFHFTLPAI